MRKKILFFTSTRADYGILKPLIQLFVADSNYQTELLVTGTHLEEKFGFTHSEIEKDQISIKYKINIKLSDDSETGVAYSAGLGVQEYAQVLNHYKPDLAIVLGDRFEALSFAISCQIVHVPLVHLHGGEITEGAIDESFRHSITKLSQYHLTSNQTHAHRVIQMGEQPEKVLNSGALGVDNAVQLKKLSREDLEKDLKIKFKSQNFLVTFHPETLSNQSVETQIKNFLSALDQYIQKEADSLFVITLPNADPGNQIIFDTIKDFKAKHASNVEVFSSLGVVRYLSLMSFSTAVVGNSSSGIIEAPALKIPTLNVGDRQKGRERAQSIIDVPCEVQAIVSGMNQVAHYTQKGGAFNSPYGDGRAAERMKKFISEKIEKGLQLRKSFYEKH